MQKKQIAIGIALAFACVPAMADTAIGFYSGMSVGQITLKDSISGVGIKESGTGFSLFTGYRWNEYGALEVAYLAGSADDTVSGVRIDTDASAIQASALLQIPVSARFEGFVRAGFSVWDAEHHATDGRVFLTQKNDGTDFILGLGAAFHATPKVSLRAEYGGAEFDGTDVRILSLAGLYRF